jgi:hypothetical protein
MKKNHEAIALSSNIINRTVEKFYTTRSFINYYWVVQIKENVMGGACSMHHGRVEKSI